ncbi:MAG: histone deacetylase [Actinobacteria bacterium]|nr:histone deacetylase [Actinomycetota bacterium]
MALHIYTVSDHAAHDPGPSFVERPARVESVMDALGEAAIDIEIHEATGASLAHLEAVHDAAHLQWLEGLDRSGGALIGLDTVVSEGSFDVATRAAGAVSVAAERAMSNRERSFCVVRPPGHHATRDKAMGFCLINNVAVAAYAARDAGAQRVAVVDFDVHHGNGTQEIFYSDPSVLYLSVHQYPWYPGPSGVLELTGAGPGEGANINLPLPGGCQDGVYRECFERIVMPCVREFTPDIILVSAGFDAHSKDPLSSMEVSAEGFSAMTEGIVSVAEEVCEGRVVLCLEGGYHLASLAESAVGSARALLGEQAASSVPGPVGRQRRVVDDLVAFHSRTWKVA